jgi:anti-anti-sigma factor
MWRTETDENSDTTILVWSPERGHEILPDRAMHELDGVIAARPGAWWVLDVHAIPVISSNAIAQLIGVARRVSLAHGKIALAKPAPAVATVLKMTRLTKLLPIFDTVELARASFA